MKIITCAGYYRTGSSAITDYLSEFQSCSCVGSTEFRFIYDTDGIRDLEYNIVENNDRLNTSIAIKRFIRYTKILNGGLIRRGYKKYMGDSFMHHTQEFVERITELKSEAWSHIDRYERGSLFNFIDVALWLTAVKLSAGARCFSLLNIWHEKSYYSAIDEKTFCQYAIEYIEKVIGSITKEDAEYTVVDQLLPPSNLEAYLKYFRDIKVIVVERDPRDLFILENEIHRWGNIPYRNVVEFCKWFEITRRHRKREKCDQEHVLQLNFEDLVYKYDEVTQRLMQFIGLKAEDHVLPRSHFDPERSIKNTNMKEKYPQYSKEISYIEENLAEYLYSF